MVDREAVGTGGFQSPEPQQQAWPPPGQPPRPERSPTARGRDRRWSTAAFLAGIVGVVGALLPAMDGQKVGDPDSVAFRLGVPLGLFGGLVAVVIGALCHVPIPEFGLLAGRRDRVARRRFDRPFPDGGARVQRVAEAVPLSAVVLWRADAHEPPLICGVRLTGCQPRQVEGAAGADAPERRQGPGSRSPSERRRRRRFVDKCCAGPAASRLPIHSYGFRRRWALECLRS